MHLRSKRCKRNQLKEWINHCSILNARDTSTHCQGEKTKLEQMDVFDFHILQKMMTIYIYISLNFFTYMTSHPTLTYSIAECSQYWEWCYDTILYLTQINWTLISSFFSSLEGLDQNCLRNQSQNWRKTRRRRKKGWNCHRCHCYCLQMRMRSPRNRCCPRKRHWKSWTNHYCCCWNWRRT